MKKLEEFKVDLPILIESGLIAIKQGDEESAKKLFNAIKVLDEKSTAPTIGFGLIALHKMDTKTACRHFEDVLKVEKTNYRAKGFLAFAHILSTLEDIEEEKKKEALIKAADLANETLENSDSESIKQLAQSILDWEQELLDMANQESA